MDTSSGSRFRALVSATRISLVCLLALCSSGARGAPVWPARPAEIEVGVPGGCTIEGLPSGPGSVSVGSVWGGRLVAGEALPLEGPGYRFISVVEKRKTNYGTDELVEAVAAAAKETAKEHPGATIVLGNIGKKKGGDIKWSVSHEGGRDIDVLYPLVDGEGVPVVQDDFIVVPPSLATTVDGVQVTLDVPTLWTFLQALLDSPHAHLQRAFVAKHIKKAILAHVATLDDSLLLWKASTILAVPTYSSAHDDHVHVRFYCSDDDLLFGCIELVDPWPWMTTYGIDRSSEILRLGAALGDPLPSAKLEAITAVESLRIGSLAPLVVPAIASPLPALREAALDALGATKVVAVLPSVIDTGARVGALDEVLALVGTFSSIAAPDVLYPLADANPLAPWTSLDGAGYLVTQELLVTIARGSGPAAASWQPLESGARIAAVEALSFLGGAGAVEPLVELLDDADAGVAAAACATLSYLTNASLEGSAACAKEAWVGWYAAHESLPWQAWMLEGFVARGTIKAGMAPRKVALALYPEVAKGGYRSVNAQRYLMDLFGVTALIRTGALSANYHFWRKVYRAHKGTLSATPISP